MICPGCGYREAVDGDVCRDCAGQLAFATADVKPCRVCSGRERNRFNQCMRCARRRTMRRYRQEHGIPESSPLVSKAEAGRLGNQARQRNRRTA